MRLSDSNVAGGAGQCLEEADGSLDMQLAAAHFQNGMVPSSSLPVTPGSANSVGSWGVSMFPWLRHLVRAGGVEACTLTVASTCTIKPVSVASLLHALFMTNTRGALYVTPWLP
jgi:hypothetical protein